MVFKLLILTSDPTLLKWKTLSSKLAAIKDTLNKTKNATWEVDVRYQDLRPVVNSKGRIDHDWYDTISYPIFREGYQEVYMHFSLEQRKALGLDAGVLGINQNDDDFVGESYGWSDENTKRGRTRLNQFIQNLLHEVRHSLNKACNRKDDTHEVHKTGVDITKVDWSIIDMDKWEPVYRAGMDIVGKLIQILGLQKMLNSLKKKLSDSQPSKLTPLVQRKAQLVLDEMELLGYPMRITDGFRGVKEQDALYAQGRTAPGLKVTNAKGGESFHNYGVAADFVFRKQGYNVGKEVWEAFGTIAEKHGFEWGGRWTSFIDIPHVQMRLGYSLKDFQEKKVDYIKFN